jgi:hypothetical protein
MLAEYLDLTDQNQNEGFAIIETSNYDYCVIQIIDNGDSSFYSTIDSGAVQSVTDGNALLSASYVAVAATKLDDGTLVTTTSSDGLYRFNVVGRYIKIVSTAQKLLVMLAKIS